MNFSKVLAATSLQDSSLDIARIIIQDDVLY